MKRTTKETKDTKEEGKKVSLLILGGTGDASELAKQASNIPSLEVRVSLAGRTSQPSDVSGIVRIGGFGGVDGLVTYLRAEQIDLLIDATHPFASQISWNAAAAVNIVGIPSLMLVRPGWEKDKSDNWVEVENVEAAANILPGLAKRVFLTIGRQQLAPFAYLNNIWFLMRAIDPPSPDIPLPQGKLLLARGPFSLEDEKKLLLEYEIDTVVSKNSGGGATYAKIIAARELGIKVVMVQRSPIPEGEKTTSAEGAMMWLVDKLSFYHRDTETQSKS
ncbi:precorrin-6x reductase [Calothrix sp. NIES-4071]|nr:precorrin-6x reductase [Calothrix sp. NIES-4071]BAZ56197.1 precorrin-6x reductase [Calothrix sp. NIES-4105]